MDVVELITDAVRIAAFSYLLNKRKEKVIPRIKKSNANAAQERVSLPGIVV